MPHKHSRRAKDPSTFDLPPSQVARPLPVNSISKKNQKNKSPAKGANQDDKKKDLKRKRGEAKLDDAPRAFKRLMAFAEGKAPRSGPDDGRVPRKGKGAGKDGEKKGRTRKAAADVAGGAEKDEPAMPTIRPGERLSDFATRVNAALPVSGLINKHAGGKDPLGLKVRRTRKETKMHKLYDQWREEDRKIKEKREEEQELAEERELEDESLGVKWKMDLEDAVSRKKKNKKKGQKRAKYIGETAGAEEDPWEEIKRKRGEAKIGLHDVVSAPPELKPVKAKFTVRGAAVDVQDIPKAAGSLRKREELQGVRDEVVASYRKLVAKNRSIPSG